MEFWEVEWGRHSGLFTAILFFLLWLIVGRFLSPRLWLRHDPDDSGQREPSEFRQIQRPDGTLLHVELCGPRDGIPLVLTHGCGGDGAEWHYIKKDFADRCRLIIWDLPGMGRSGWAANHDFSMEKLAADMNAVLELADGRPAVLVGHSTGGMVILTFCRLFPDRLRTHVAALVLAHTTYTNPAFTLSPTWLMPHLQQLLLEPLCYLAIVGSPVFWLLFRIGYLCGIAHWWIHLEMFAGTETRGQLDFAARYVFKAPISAIARTNLAMFRFDERNVLSTVPVPTLVVTGDRDITTVPDASRRIAREVRDGELVVLASARHLGIIERNEAFSQALQRFLHNAILATHSAPSN
jgi:pimeloyl-ACP methyl ester carboxylesterase